MKNIKKVLGDRLQDFTMVLALIALTIVFNIITDGRVVTSSNFQNLISGNAYVMILSIGMMMVIVIGQIDLSVGSVAAFSAMVMAIVVRDYGISWWLGILISLIVGTLIGAWQGFWVAKLNIPGFITTLGGMMIFRGAVIWISKSISIPVPKELRFFGSGYLPEWGPSTGINNSTLLLGVIAMLLYVYFQMKKYNKLKKDGEELWPYIARIVLAFIVIGFFTWIFGSGRVGTSFPIPGVILVILVIIYHTITQKTKFGRHIYAVGGNKNAAALSGVNVDRTYFYTMLNMSFLAALAGVLFVGRSTSAGPSDGIGWELDAIASVFIGGAAVSGGVGTIIATMVGGMVMIVLNNGLTLMGVGSDRTQVIKGMVLLAAVAFDVYNKEKGKISIIGRLFPSKSKTK
ncbi:sugar ABC transporter permease [Oceanivirga salmonicida]|uniref:sugar ABC transporter permease n=1 Tax=Oceanivirga salmonicida TaxID=1769291 RepID=UPI00082B111F|nr:sugar ABC transporter permease [Oceanivirga salmonicida]